MKKSSITLDNLLKEAFIDKNNNSEFGKNIKAKTEAYNSMTVWYSNYFGGNTNEESGNDKKNIKGFGIKGASELLGCSERTILNNIDSFVDNTMAGVKSYPRDKYLLALKVEHFLTFLEGKYHLSLDLKPLENFKCRDKNERRLKILKLLHSGGLTRDEIAETFGISQNTLGEDLSLLQSNEGYEFLGFKMKMSDLERTENTYKSKVNPLFYAANMSEIYSLTVGLKLLSKGTVFEHALSPIADKIYGQLSDYAREVIDKQSEISKVTFEGQKMHFLNTADFFRQESLAFTYFLKEEIPCEITYQDDQELKIVTGILHLSKDKNDRFKKVVVKAESGDVEIYIDKIRNCKAV